MPDRPVADKDLTGKLNDVLRRLRELERVLNIPEEGAAPLQTLEDSTPLGDTLHLDFGSGLQAVLIGDRYVRVQATPGETAFDAIVDGTLLTDEQSRIFAGIGEALAYLKSIGLESVNVLVRNHGATPAGSGNTPYVETANFNCPGAVHLFGLRGGTGDIGVNQFETGISWDLATFRPLASGVVQSPPDFYIHNFQQVRIGNNALGRFRSLHMYNSHLATGSPGGAICTEFVGSKTTLDLVDGQTLASEGAWMDRCDTALRTTSGAAGTFVLGSTGLFFYGGSLSANSSGPSNAIHLTLPPQFDILSSESAVNRTGSGPLNVLNIDIPGNANGRLHVMAGAFSPGGSNISAPSIIDYLDLRGGFDDINIVSCSQLVMDVSCKNLTVGGPPAGGTAPLVRAQVNGNLDLNHSQVDIVLLGPERIVTLRSAVNGFITCRDVTKSSGALLNYVANAVFGHLIVSHNEVDASGTARAYDFASGANDNLLIMRGTTDWPVAGTDAGARNLVFPEDFNTRDDLRGPVIATASLPAAGAAQDGRLILEDAGAGDRNLVIYAAGQRFRIDGGTAF